MATIDDLSVRISADTADFQVGAEGVESSLSDVSSEAIQTAAAMQTLQGRTDEAGDEMTDLTAKSTTAALGMEGLGFSATGTSGRFGILAAVTVGSLVPALITLSSVLFPLVGALAGFVAIAGSIAGIGIVGALGAIATHTERLKRQFEALTDTAEEVFGETFFMAANVLEIFMMDLEAILPALAPTSDELEHLGGIFAALSREVTQALPPLVDLGVTLTREFLPGFVDFVDNVGPELPEIFNNLAGVFDRVLPMLQAFGAWFMEFAPEFTEFGFLVLDTINPALSFFGDLLTDTTRAINDLDNGIGSLIAGGSILAPVLLGIATLLTGPIAAAVGIAIGAVVALDRVWSNNIAGIRSYIEGLAMLVGRAFPAIQETISALASGADLGMIRQEVGELADAFETQFMANVEALIPVVDHFVQTLRDNKEEFTIIGGAIGTVVSGALNLATILVNILGPALRTLIIPLFNILIDTLDIVLEKVAQYIQLLSAVRSGDLQGAIGVSEEFLEIGAGRAIGGEGLPRPPTREERIEIILEEQTDVIDSRIRSTSESVVQEESRRNRRNTGTPSGVR